jgi:hypothetical protein
MVGAWRQGESEVAGSLWTSSYATMTSLPTTRAESNHVPAQFSAPVEPFKAGMLDGGEVQVFLHGGPGSDCTPENRRLFNPAECRSPPMLGSSSEAQRQYAVRSRVSP